MVSTYEEWKNAVENECKKLSSVSEYLNNAGKERFRVFLTLEDLMDFCDTPEELLGMISKKENLSDETVADLGNRHASAPLHVLRKIAGETD